MNSKWVLVTGVVALIALVAIVLAILAQSSSSSKTEELATGDARLVEASQTVSALNDAQSTSVAQLATADVEASRTVSALNDAQSTSETMATQTISALVDAQSTSSAQLAAAEIRIERAATSVAISSAHQTTLSSRLYEQTRRVLALEATTRCDRTPTTIDYSSQSGVSNSLKTWLEETIGTIDDAEWDIVWDNSKTAIHYLYGEFLYVYIVFFDEPDLNHANSIFDVSNICCLEF